MSQNQNGSNPYANNYPNSFEPPSGSGGTGFGSAGAGYSGYSTSTAAPSTLSDGSANTNPAAYNSTNNPTNYSANYSSANGSAQFGTAQTYNANNQYTGFSSPTDSYTAPQTANTAVGYQAPLTTENTGYSSASQFSPPTQTYGTGTFGNTPAPGSSLNLAGISDYSSYGQTYDQSYTQYNQNQYAQGYAQTNQNQYGQTYQTPTDSSAASFQTPTNTTATDSSYGSAYPTATTDKNSVANPQSAYPYGQTVDQFSQYGSQYGSQSVAAQYAGQYAYGDSTAINSAGIITANIPGANNSTVNGSMVANAQTAQNPTEAPADSSNFTVSSSGNKNFYIVSGIIIVVLIITTVVLLVIQANNANNNSNSVSAPSSSSPVSTTTSLNSSAVLSSRVPAFSTSTIASNPIAPNPGLGDAGTSFKKNNDQKLSAVWLRQKFPQTDLNMDGLCTNPNKCGETVDPDADGLNNIEEYNYQTDPLNEDTTGSGISDGDKIKIYSLDPNRRDSNGNGTSDGADIVACLDPVNRSGAKLTAAQQKQISDNTKLYNLNSATIKTLQSAGATSQDLTSGLILANCGSTATSSIPGLPTPPPIGGIGSSSSSRSSQQRSQSLQTSPDNNDVGISFN